MIEILKMKTWEIPAVFSLYRTAFPASERKPFSIIVRMARKGRTDLWTVRSNGRFAGFASTVNGQKIVLLDYFAVKKKFRGQGTGSAALKMLMEHYQNRGFFVEIESTLEKTEDLPQRKKRRGFYVNCGMTPMGTEADVFGVRMELLGVRCHLNFSDYRNFYQENLSPWAAAHIQEVEP